MLPDFLIIGAQKCGTTSIYQALKPHPHLFFPDIKEINYFFFQKKFSKGIQYYQNFFKNAPVNALKGEASPGYISNPDAPERIKLYLPNCKLILSIRNPVGRAYSQYWDNRRQLKESRSFDECLQLYLKIGENNFKEGYFARGFYYNQILRYLKHFNPNQLLILIFDDLITAPKLFYQTILNFLSLDDDLTQVDYMTKSNPFSVHKNFLYHYFLKNNQYTKYFNRWTRRLLRSGQIMPYEKPPMSAWAQAVLRDLYNDTIFQLSNLLERDLTYWLQNNK